MSVRHSGGSDFDNRVIDVTSQIIESAPQAMAQVAQWKALELKPHVQEAYAHGALEIIGKEALDTRKILQVRRKEDAEPSLWNTFNVIQENAMKGGIGSFSANGRRVKTRPINSVAEDTRVNKALWAFTEKVAELSK